MIATEASQRYKAKLHQDTTGRFRAQLSVALSNCERRPRRPTTSLWRIRGWPMAAVSFRLPPGFAPFLEGARRGSLVSDNTERNSARHLNWRSAKYPHEVMALRTDTESKVGISYARRFMEKVLEIAKNLSSWYRWIVRDDVLYHRGRSADRDTAQCASLVLYSQLGDDTRVQYHRQMAEETISAIQETDFFLAHRAAAAFLYERLDDIGRARHHWETAYELCKADFPTKYSRFLLKTDGPEVALEMLAERDSQGLERAIIGLDRPEHREHSIEMLATIAQDPGTLTILQNIAKALLLASGDAHVAAITREMLGDESPKWTDMEDSAIPEKPLEEIHGLGLLMLGLHRVILGQRESALHSFTVGTSVVHASATPTECSKAGGAIYIVLRAAQSKTGT